MTQFDGEWVKGVSAGGSKNRALSSKYSSPSTREIFVGNSTNDKNEHGMNMEMRWMYAL